jgi:hypothetical protein
VTPRAVAIVTLGCVTGLAHADPGKPAEPAKPAAAPARAEPGDTTPLVTEREEIDPAVIAATDANLESIENRQGFTFAASIGGGTQIGFGIPDSVGRGGAFALRLGHVAGLRTVATFELDVSGALHHLPPDAMGHVDPIHINTDINILGGIQRYAGESLWLRGAAGVGLYFAQNIQLNPPPMPRGDLRLVGPTGLFGIGVDLFRIKSSVIGVEASASAMINSKGLLFASGARIGVSFD